MINNQYKNWIQDLKKRIYSAKIKASMAVNHEMIMLYWDIGKSIAEKQNEYGWGSKVIEEIAKDLKRELPDSEGFSRSNLFAMRKFYLFYKESEFVHQLGGQLKKDNILILIPWRHHVAILGKCSTFQEAVYYIQKTIQNNWSRAVLEVQLDSKLIERKGKAQNNFELTLPKAQSDLAQETIKDPYKFDFLTLQADVQELHLEKHLTENITQFLLELGKGFAFVGRQYPIQIGSKERKIDLLFYHLKMHCYVVIDLKMGEFEPEFAGKMNYYLSAVDKLIKTKQDKPSIGIILCKSKESLEIEYSLQDLSKPMGISEFTFNELPQNIKENMPTVEELENELLNINNE
jgi:predicted nuclease of restriction endonuclease-like (RecB) superfamily